MDAVPLTALEKKIFHKVSAFRQSGRGQGVGASGAQGADHFLNLGDSAVSVVLGQLVDAILSQELQKLVFQTVGKLGVMFINKLIVGFQSAGKFLLWFCEIAHDFLGDSPQLPVTERGHHAGFVIETLFQQVQQIVAVATPDISLPGFRIGGVLVLRIQIPGEHRGDDSVRVIPLLLGKGPGFQLIGSGSPKEPGGFQKSVPYIGKRVFPHAGLSQAIRHVYAFGIGIHIFHRQLVSG